MRGLALAVFAWTLSAGPVAGEPRDPFAPPPTESLPVPDTPLQRLDLDDIRLAALVYDGAAPRALLEDPAGLGYVARVGTPVGRRGGTVVAIEPGRLHIHEPEGESDIVLELTGAREGRQ